jgi:acetolactate synthase regulatory subunit
MKWLISLETNSDPITLCRLMNIFRRKGLKIVTLSVSAQAAGYTVLVLVEMPERDAEHIFNFLRMVPGVQHVASYRHEASTGAEFLFVDGAADTANVTRILEAFPGANLLFASNGKFLLEVPADSGSVLPDFNEAGFLPFARVHSTRGAPQAVPASC